MSRWSSRSPPRCLLRRRAYLHQIPPRQSCIFSLTPHSTVSTSNFKYQLIEDVETLENYQPGGYHPVQINDRLHNQYRVVHKLGYGSFSITWLALDEKSSKYVAVKVGIAEDGRREVDILSKLAAGVEAVSCSRAAEGASLIPPPIDRFSLDGPNGTHPCFARAPARCSLMDAKMASGRRLFQLDVARSLAAQLLLAVSYVHSLGYIHGDLHIGNLLLRLPSSLNNLSVDQLYDKFGAPDLEPIIRTDGQPFLEPGVPPYAVTAVWLGAPSHEIILRDASLLLSDFGVAFRPSEQSHFESSAPRAIRPPEPFFEPKTPLSFPADIWSLGCTIFELLAHRPLIDVLLAPDDDITAQQIYLQGRLPAEWWDKWELRSKWFDEAGAPLRNNGSVWSWDRKFEEYIQEPRESRGMEVIKNEERTALFRLLRWMLAFRPSERPSAEEVLETEWMKRWALPAYEEGKKAQERVS